MNEQKRTQVQRMLIIPLLIVALVVSFVTLNTFKSKNEQIKKIPKEERIMLRDLQEIEMTKDPALGYVPYERMESARRYTEKLIEEDNYRGAISGVSFTNYGPTNQGGRTRAIMFDPNDATNKRVFSGGVSGGIWKTEDITSAATSWTVVHEMGNIAISDFTYDPQNTMTFYAGTGEAYSTVTPGNGIYKSTDGGTTWTHMATSTQFKYITHMIIKVEGGISVLYVGSKEQHVGNDVGGGSTTFIGTSGLFRSADGGSTWNQVLPNADGGQPPVCDEIEIDASGNLWASTGKNAYGHKGGDIFKCTTGCNTSTNWTKMYDASANGFSTVDRTVIACAPSDVNTIYAVAGNNNGSTDTEYFIKSTNGGSTWSNLTIPKNYDLSTCTPHATNHFTRGQATYDLVMTVHPTNKDLVLLGAIDLWRTTDGFTNTAHVGSWYAATAPCDKYIHADHHAILWRPGNNNEVLFGNDGGVFYSTDAGNSTVSAPSFLERFKDMVTAQLYGADISPVAGANEFIAGLQDNGTKDWDTATGTETPEVTGGDGAHAHIDQTDANTMVSSYIYNQYYVTTDEWSSQSSVSPSPSTGRFINPTDYDDTNNILYGASNADQLCRVTAIGTTNTLVDGIAVTGAALGTKMATTIRVDRNTPSTIYVGTDAGKVYKILNANGATLTSTDISTGLPTGWVSSIDVENGNSNHMLVTIANFGTASVWESTNGGTSWTNIEGNIPDMPVRWGIFSPTNNDQAFVATELGIWSTDNINGGSTNWGVTNTGLADVRTDMIKYRTSDNTLVVATYGRGLYTFTPPSGDKNLAISGLRLQGAMPSSGTTMNTTINSLIPTSDPYGQSITAGSIPANAVDWVKIELRSGGSASTATTVVATTAAFLLSDGTVKAVDGNDMKFNSVADGNYYVSVSHRNHLRIITNAPVALASGTVSLDLATATIFSNPAITTNTPTTTVNGVVALWGGDANGNHKVTYNGGSNDREAILAQLSFNILGEDLTYQSEDVNMNAKSTYNGGTNDRESILNILGFNTLGEINAHHP